MGIGLSISGVNMNRLPGWDKNSFGYHGDDGHSFCSSGSGHPYGPTFTTGMLCVITFFMVNLLLSGESNAGLLLNINLAYLFNL